MTMFRAPKKSLVITIPIIAVLLMLVSFGCGSQEQQSVPDYPTKPVELTVPFPAGGGIDLPGRLVAEYAAKKWGIPVNVVNKPGASGVTGALEVLKAKNDGYSLMVDSPGSSSIQSATVKDVPYKLEDRTYVAKVISMPMVYLVNPQKPWKTLKDVEEAIKQDPKNFKWGSAGASTVTDFALGQLFDAFKVDPLQTQKVAFPGGPPAVNALAGGHIDLTAVSLGSSLPFIESGKIRAVAVIMPERSQELPDVPTAAEQGYKTLTAAAWIGISGPKDLPDYVIKKWEEVIAEALKDQEFLAKADKLGLRADYLAASEYKEFVLKEATEAAEFNKKFGTAK